MEDWKAGDEAFCVNRKGWFDRFGTQTDGPKWGSIHKVTNTMFGDRGLGLSFTPWDTALFDSTMFKKLPPLDPETETEEIKELEPC